MCERRRSLSSERLPTVKGTCVRVRIRGRVRVRVRVRGRGRVRVRVRVSPP